MRLENSSLPPLFFSISHTKTAYFIAVSDENIGIDGEEISRKTNYAPILEKFHAHERNLIKTDEDFLTFWTAKESIIKWLGGAISKDLKKVCYVNNKVTYNGLELPLYVTQIKLYDHVLSVCSEKAEKPQFEKV